MAVLLYIDTSGATGTVALSGDDRLYTVLRHHDAKEQVAVLNTLIDRVFQESGMNMQQLDAICVCAGPGSYTGLRVGLGTAKGIAFALDKPLMLFNRMMLIAMHIEAEYELAQKKTVILKARKEEYFIACFDELDQPEGAPQHVFFPDLINAVRADSCIVTDDEAIAFPNKRILLPHDFILDMAPWVRLAGKRWVQRQFDDLAYSEPFYLKAAYTTVSKK